MLTEAPVVSSGKYQEVYNVATNLYGQNPDWVTFFREMLGINGIIRQAFPGQGDLTQFEKSDEFEQIQRMLAKLRENTPIGQGEEGKEPTRVITVRLPQSLHESLRAEAHERHTSMNKLCISKLLQIVDGALIPTDA